MQGTTPGRQTWIDVGEATHQGFGSRDVLVRNNLANYFALNGMVGDHNLVVTDTARVYTAHDLATFTFDLHLRPGSPAIGAGSRDQAPATDLSGAPRVPPIDLGAYRYGPYRRAPGRASGY